MSKHTAGPWHTEDTNSAHLSKVVVGATQGLNGSTVVIGQCAGPDKEANATLIAAAPDMLAALQSALTAWSAAKLGDIAAADWMNAAEAQMATAVAKAGV